MLINEKFTDIRIIETRKKLKMAMIHHLTNVSYSEISINAIAKTAGVNRSTFYNHYQNKNELLVDIKEEIICDFIASFKAPYLKKKSFKRNDISPKTVKLFHNVYEHRRFYEAIVKSDIVHLFQNELSNALKDIFIDELDLPYLKINREINSIYSASAIVGMVFSWVKNGFVYSPDYMAEQLIGIINIPINQSLIAHNSMDFSRKKKWKDTLSEHQ